MQDFFHQQFSIIQSATDSWILELRESNLDQCLKALETPGGVDENGEPLRYTVRPFLMNSLWYGLPQSRERVYIVAIRLDGSLATQPKQYLDNVRSYLKQMYLKPPKAVTQLKFRVQPIVMYHESIISHEVWPATISYLCNVCVCLSSHDCPLGNVQRNLPSTFIGFIRWPSCFRMTILQWRRNWTACCNFVSSLVCLLARRLISPKVGSKCIWA